MVEYLQLLDDVLTKGVPRHGEKTEGTLTIFGAEVKFNFADGFPLLTVRDLTSSWQKIITAEVPWMLSGSTSATVLEKKYGSKLWNRWAEDSRKKLGTKEGELGPVYGRQLRTWHKQWWNRGTDQLTDVVKRLKDVPETRRGVITLWDPDDVEYRGKKIVNVANCITMLHLARMSYKLGDEKYEDRLDMIMTQRSADIPAGVPHDVADWALVQMLIAAEIGIPVGTFTHHIEDGQIYDLQRDKVKELLKREPLPRPSVTIENSGPGTIYSHMPQDFKLNNYRAHEKMFIPTAT